jgi:PIN domain nuclease of toxin-antitoxin system
VNDGRVVLDSSAVLALVNREPGGERVLAALPDAVISAVNLSEVVAKLVDRGATMAAIEEALSILRLDVRSFDTELARAAGELRRLTRDRGLSLGDRACLALAAQLGAVALTADRTWAGWTQGEASVALIR